MDLIEDYKYLLAMYLRDISKRYGVLYYDVLRGKVPAEVQAVYAEGLAQMFEYMTLRHGLDLSDTMAIHETIIEIVLTEFIDKALNTPGMDNARLLH